MKHGGSGGVGGGHSAHGEVGGGQSSAMAVSTDTSNRIINHEALG